MGRPWEKFLKIIVLYKDCSNAEIPVQGLHAKTIFKEETKKLHREEKKSFSLGFSNLNYMQEYFLIDRFPPPNIDLYTK